MYPEEYRLNLIERQLALSLKVKRSDEPKKDTDEKYSDVPELTTLCFLKFSNEV